MQKLSFEELVERIVQRDGRYRPPAYDFVREALDYTQRKTAPEAKPESERHVTGQQLLEGIREFALAHLGPMAITVFDAWGITRCEDFGEIVFNLIEHRVLRKTEADCRDHFKSIYGFEEAFVHPFLPASKLAQLRREAVAGSSDTV